MMSYFQILPIELVHVVISEWIFTTDLARLDSALCCRADRCVYLDTIKKSYFLTEGIEGKPLTNSYFQWLVQRNIQVRTLDLTRECLENFLSVIQLGHYVTKARKLHASFQTELIGSCAMGILKKCGDVVESLDLSNSTDADLWSMMKNVASFPKLRSVNLSGCTQMSHFTLDLFFSKCPIVESINLSHMSKLQDCSIVSLVKQCPFLKDINLSNCMSLTDATIEALLEYSPQLRTINLSDGVNYTATRLQMLFRHPSVASLKTIVLGGCIGVNDAVLYAIAEMLIVLDSLSLSGCPFVTKAGVEKVAQSCVHLHSLYVNDCPLLLKDNILEMMPTCKQLQVVQAKHCEVDYTA